MRSACVFVRCVDEVFEGPRSEFRQHGDTSVGGPLMPSGIAEVQKTYPYKYDQPNGSLYFSRLADQNNTAYEGYGYWIPGNARDALLAIFVRGQIDEINEALKTALNYSPST
jgi:hypothetical protein